ncbi:MAG: polyribonucleotide nucleotidyltransferase, partial [Thermoanaerobaculia bacterium]
MKQRKEIRIGEGTMVVETGYLANQADGSCTVRFGDTVVLATACMDTKAGITRDFLPLTVDYREYTYAGGKIPGGFFKREGRPSEKEIITSRQIDRPLRPLFPEGYTAETQIISFVLSADGENDPDVLAINGASTALVLSNIPFYHPVGAVRVGLVQGQVVFNPSNSQRDISDLDLMVVGTEEAVVMVEAGANQVSEETLLDAIFRGHEEIQKVIKAQHELYRGGNWQKPAWDAPPAYPETLYEQVRSETWERMKRALFTKRKFERKAAVSEVVKGYLEQIPEEEEERRVQVKKIFSRLEEEILREAVLDERTRFDGRRL